MIAPDHENYMPTPPKVIEYRELSDYLPHRFPFLLVDRVLTYEPSKMIRGVKNVSSAEPYWRASPGRIYPPSLIIESVGQLAGILYALSRREAARDVLLGSISDVKILGRLSTPDQLIMEVWIDKELDGAVVAHGWAQTKQGKIVVLGQMIAVIRSRDYPQPPG